MAGKEMNKAVPAPEQIIDTIFPPETTVVKVGKEGELAVFVFVVLLIILPAVSAVIATVGAAMYPPPGFPPAL